MACSSDIWAFCIFCNHRGNCQRQIIHDKLAVKVTLKVSHLHCYVDSGCDNVSWAFLTTAYIL